MTTALMKQRQERFCQEIIKGSNQSDAYRLANPLSKRWKPNTVHIKASQMMALDKVKIRLAELKAELAVEFKYTREQHIEELKEERKFAKDLQNPSTSLKATELVGKVCGHYQETVVHKGDKNNPIQHSLTINFVKK